MLKNGYPDVAKWRYVVDHPPDFKHFTVRGQEVVPADLVATPVLLTCQYSLNKLLRLDRSVTLLKYII